MPDPTDMRDEELGDDFQAGELALGVLSGEERAVALRRVIAEPAFAAEVDAWRLRLAPLMDGIAEAPVPEGAWGGIERAIGNTAQVAQIALGRWRAAAVGASALAAGLAAILVLQPAPAPTVIVQQRPVQPMLAQVAGAKGVMLVTAHYDAASGQLRVRTDNLPAGNLVPELWVIAGDAAPRSLGFVAIDGVSDYVPSADLRRAMADGVTIAVTMEPRAATPHAAPSGTVLGTARLTTI